MLANAVVPPVHRHAEIGLDVAGVEAVLRSRGAGIIDLHLHSEEFRGDGCPVAPPGIAVDQVVDGGGRPLVSDAGDGGGG